MAATRAPCVAAIAMNADRTPPERPTEMLAGQPAHGPDEAAAVPLFSRDDLSTLALLPFGILVAWCTPERSWRYFGGTLAHLQRPRVARLRGRIRAVVGQRRLAMPIDVAAAAYLANLPLPKLLTLRLHAPRSPQLRVRLEGREHVERALAAGHGAILWIAPFLFGSLLSKIAFHQSGFAVSHLSRHGHGFSSSRFGARFLNPLRTAIESRYVERIVIGPDGSATRPVMELQRRLARNGLVSIMVGAEGSHVLPAPVFDGVVNVATGVPRLMLRSGASLLPVFAIRSAASEFVTFVAPPIRAPGGLSQASAVSAVIEELGRRLEQSIARWPDQFTWDAALPRASRCQHTA
jgi:lauroyl/myristoyl acyltransferase